MSEPISPPTPNSKSSPTLADLQALISRMYDKKDRARGVAGNFMWLMEEVGEFATALRSGTPEEQELEAADVLAWFTTICNIAGIDLTQAIAKKYGGGCPGCGQFECVCRASEKP